MTDPNLTHPNPTPDEHRAPIEVEDEPSSGPSLPLLYTLIALALIAAIGCAMLIVLPFYHRAH